jgi:hypothetical protein
MEESLSVPTATSVRAIPAKLLMDNRVVVNNHLARGRGGKVSFTHLIGWAVVRAAADNPGMNASFAEVEGKPAIVQHAELNLGLAIDLAKADGTRQLLVPSIKSAQAMDFAQFWATYEDMVRKARAGRLVVDDFAGTTMTLTNPGTIGTNHSGAQADARTGLHHRRGGPGVPGGVGGRLAGVDRAQCRLQDPHPHLDLRPSHHPGRGLREFLRAHPPAPARGGRVLRGHLPRTAGALRAGSLGSGRLPATRPTWTRPSGSRRSSTPIACAGT